MELTTDDVKEMVRIINSAASLYYIWLLTKDSATLQQVLAEHAAELEKVVQDAGEFSAKFGLD